MKKSVWKYMRYTLFLALMIVGCSGISGAIDGSNATYAKNIDLSPAVSIYGGADLMPTSLHITLSGCYHGSLSQLQGTRLVRFYYKIRNIGGALSSHFFIIINDQSGFWAGGSSPTLIPAGQYVTETYATYFPTGTRYFTLTVYPLDPLYYQVGGYWSNYIDWSLDANPSNNSINYKIFLPACP